MVHGQRYADSSCAPDGRDLLTECAEDAGLNMQNVEKVLNGEIISVKEIEDQVHRVHAVGINSIPHIVFEVQGLAQGSWRENPALQDNKYRATHHGSGSKKSFKALLQQLHGEVAGKPTTRGCDIPGMP